MKRQILFRGYSESLNKWVEGDLVQCDGLQKWILPIETNDLIDIIPVHPDSVGQFTGMCDIDGNKVFEGDIDSLGRFVEFSYGSFILNDKKTGQYALLGDCEFIKITGNTFQP
jgi:hypothetical protein